MKQNSILKVGLTGGIGCGKSTVSKIFSDNNIPVIDADIIARKVLENNPEILSEIKKRFGYDFFDTYGNFIRKDFGNYIFSNKEKRIEYEQIIIPYIKEDIFKKIEEYNEMGETICIIDAPTLIETSLHLRMDLIIVVVAEEDVQIKRIINRDNLNADEAKMRINNQLPLEEKCKFADYIINNNETIDTVNEKVKQVINKLREYRGKNA